MPQRVLQFLADGNEELGTLISANVLMRAGFEVTVAGVNLNEGAWAVGSRGQKTFASTTLEALGNSVHDFDIVLVPGGVVASRYLASREDVLDIVRHHHAAGKLTAFLCAGPLVAKAAGIHRGKRITSNPFLKEDFTQDYLYSEDRVVIDDNVVSSRGPGTAFEFAFAILSVLLPADRIEQLKPGMVLPPAL
ncbi:unnamed protein product [Parajaminaea phylloscopi]